ncbi:MAG TPA: hypothetical protein VGL86_05465 [Polyangia bacterium]|jgi:hypothetical protein
MRVLSVVLGTLVGAGLAGCGGAKSHTKYAGSVTVSAQGSWSYSDGSGGTTTGNESFNAHCTNDGGNVGEFTASITVHQDVIDNTGGNGSSTTDATGSTDQPISSGNGFCLVDDADPDSFGIEIELADFDVTGMTVAQGVTVPIDGTWHQADFANAGSISGGSFSNAANGSAGGGTGTVSFHSGDTVGGSPSMVVTPSVLPATIPETVSWSFSAVS